jgi:hypothetical protein
MSRWSALQESWSRHAAATKGENEMQNGAGCNVEIPRRLIVWPVKTKVCIRQRELVVDEQEARTFAYRRR